MTYICFCSSYSNLLHWERKACLDNSNWMGVKSYRLLKLANDGKSSVGSKQPCFLLNFHLVSLGQCSSWSSSGHWGKCLSWIGFDGVNWHWRNIPRMELLEPIVESFYHSLDTAPVFWRFRLLLGPFRFKSKKTSPNLLFIEGSLLSLCLCLWSQHCSTFQQDQTKPDCIQYRLFQVVLAGTSTKAVAAVKDLIYSGTCHLDEVA